MIGNMTAKTVVPTTTGTKIKCETFNCFGFKQSSLYVCDRLLENDILCLTETWLRPNDLNVIKETVSCDERLGANDDFIVFNKTSMAFVDSSYRGRPYGGLAIIVRKNALYRVSELPFDSDRILCVGIYDNSNNLIHIVVCIYMPYYDASDSDKTCTFVDVLDNLQSLLDKYQAAVPIKILGDFNVQLPVKSKLHDRWYRGKGFTPHSSIMYDFIVTNNMLVSDMMYSQCVNYTYFSHARNVYTWIDHVLSTSNDTESILNCTIIDHNSCNVSDHLPVHIEFLLKCNESQGKTPLRDKYSYVQPNWSNYSRNEKYCNILASKLSNLSYINDLVNYKNSEEVVNKRLYEVNDAIHSATKEAGCIPARVCKPKNFWCPMLSQLRDKKRFWWHLWTAAGRPRSGHVYVIYKSLKKEFRKLCRINSSNNTARQLKIINHHFNRRNMKAFWNRLKRLQRSDVNTTLQANDLMTFYKSIMTDRGIDPNNCDHKQVMNFVEEKAVNISASTHRITIHPNDVRLLINKLNRGVSAGCDGITAEHLNYGLSDALCNVLADIYSTLLSYSIVPEVLQTGIIIPILKKSSLDANVSTNYRPVTLSSVHSKLVEMLLIPETDIHSTQFGFRDKRGTSFVTSFVNDIAAYFNERGSPVYISSLDAEKCFDSIWHDGLLYKLWGILAPNKWYYLYKWYKSSYAVVSWNGMFSTSFKITKGMKQGSVLSPTLFNIFVNDLLISLDKAPEGVRVFNNKYNACAYADDITVFSSTVTGLQELVNICVSYADKWRFNFGVRKTQFTTLGKNILKDEPVIYIKNCKVQHKNDIELLGVSMDSSCDYSNHVNNRISSCRRGIYGLAPSGMSYPGLCTEAKTYIWKSVGAPLLFYSMDCIPLSKAHIKQLYSAQGNTIKNVLGLSKRNRHSILFNALKIESAETYVTRTTQSFFRRVFAVKTPLMELQCSALAHYMSTGQIVKNTIIEKLVKSGVSPVTAAFTKIDRPPDSVTDRPTNNGIVDSLKYLLLHENFVKPWMAEHMMCDLLTKAF